MAGPRDRSRYRGMDSRNKYESQDMQSSHLNSTDEGSTVRSEESYEDYNHGLPPNSGAQYLDLILLRTCKQRMGGIVENCKAQLARTLRTCIGPLTNHRLMALFITSVLCILLLLAFRGNDPRAEPPKYGLDGETGRAMQHQHFPITVSRHHNTAYRTIDVVDNLGPMAIPSDLEDTSPAKRQHLLHLVLETETSSPVLGLYFMPVSATEGEWSQTQQDTHHPSSPMTHPESSQDLQKSQSSRKWKPQVELLLHYHKIYAHHNLSANQADADSTYFARWGVEILYALHRHSRRSLHILRESCIKNACSPHEQLISMCNATMNISDSFQKQECEWCWPENQRKHLEIEKHCTEVSKRAFNTTIIICGIFLFCTVIVAVMLAPRILRNIRTAKLDRLSNENATTTSSLPKKSGSVSNPQLLNKISKTSRSSDIAKIRINGKSNRNGSSGENDRLNPWYKPNFAKSRKHSGISPECSVSVRSRLQKQRTKPLDQGIADGDCESDERVAVLPPSPPAISSRVFSEIKDMGQGSLVSDAGTNSSQHSPQETPLRSSKQSRAVSSGSEQNTSEPTHRRDASRPNPYKLH